MRQREIDNDRARVRDNSEIFFAPHVSPLSLARSLALSNKHMRINELGVLSDERELQRLKSELALATADKSRAEAALSSAMEEVHFIIRQ